MKQLLAVFLTTVLIGTAASTYRPASASEVAALSMQPMLQAVATGSGTLLGTGTMSQCRETAVFIQWSLTSTAGVVKVESAHDAAYTGTWATLATVTWAAANKEDLVQITGTHGALRTRISTTIADGTVSTWGTCN